MGERFGAIDFDEFHQHDLPARLAAGNGPRAERDLAGARPLAFRLDDGRAYTYTPAAEGFEIAPGDDAAHCIVELAYGDWCDFVWELRTSFALLYGDRVRFPRGGFGHFARWEPALRAAIDGQTIYEFEQPPPIVNADGDPLDLNTTFTLDDSDDAIRDHLERAGFVHLRDVFAAGEIAAMVADVETAVDNARADDGRSWWTTVDGKDVCNRVNYLNEQSDVIAALSHDPRLQRIGGLSGTPLSDAADRLDGHGVVIKVPGASTGLADLPWHRDCGMGGHPVKCPMLNVGIQLDPASAGAGQLHMIAGSHLGTSRLPTPDETASLPTVAIDTQPGDVTVHFGHTLHAAPPPTDRSAAGRRALYVTYVTPLVFDMVPAGQGYNDILYTRDSGHIRHVDEFK